MKRLLNNSRKSPAAMVAAIAACVLMGTVILHAHASALIGDINGDGVVNVLDLSALLTSWQTTNASADLNHDGIVNVFDLSVLLTHWGQTGSTPTPSISPSSSPSGLLTRQGASLMLNGSAYKYVGVDAYGLATCDGNTYSSADLDAFFQALRPHSVTRFWATKKASLAQIDLVIARAAANGQMLLPSLIDGPNNCNAAGDTVDANFIFMTGSTYTSYINWIDALVPQYKNSPAIAAWEIGNELDHYGVTPQQMQAFNTTVSAHIKADDPTHLVESGLAGNISTCCNYSGSPSNWQVAHNAPDLDITDIHEYQYDQSGNTGVHSSWSTYLAGAAALGRPIIVGEVGAQTSQPTNTLCANSSETIEWLANLKFQAYLGAGASGVNIWNWMKAQPGWDSNGCNGQHFFFGPSNPVLQLIQTYPL